MKLKSMRPGASAVISGYENYDKRYLQKLMAMGLTRGTEFTITKIAPLGDPVEIDVRGFRLSLRKEEADVLIVEATDAK